MGASMESEVKAEDVLFALAKCLTSPGRQGEHKIAVGREFVWTCRLLDSCRGHGTRLLLPDRSSVGLMGLTRHLSGPQRADGSVWAWTGVSNQASGPCCGPYPHRRLSPDPVASNRFRAQLRPILFTAGCIDQQRSGLVCHS